MTMRAGSCGLWVLISVSQWIVVKKQGVKKQGNSAKFCDIILQWSAIITRSKTTLYYISHHIGRGRNWKHQLNSQKTPHISLLRTSDGLSLVRILMEIDHAIMAPHCICCNAVQCLSQKKIMKTKWLISHMHIYIKIPQKHMHIWYCTQTCVCTCVRTHMHLHKLTHMHACIYIHINTCNIYVHGGIGLENIFYHFIFSNVSDHHLISETYSSAVIADEDVF